MDFEQLERAWRSGANTPAEAAEAYLKETLMHTLNIRRRARLLHIAVPAVALTAFTALVVRAMLDGTADLGREWGVLALLATPWLALAAIVLRRRDDGTDGGSPMRETLQGLLADNRAARLRCRILAVALLAFLVPLALSIRQLLAVGKIDGAAAWQMSLLFAAALGASAAFNAVRYFTVLKPEGRRLERLLEDYGA